jgi:hypothetical protein
MESKKVYIEYTSHTYGGAPIDPEDRWTSYTDTVISVSFKRLHREPPTRNFFYDSIDLPNDDMLKLDKLYLVVVRYGTGSTFGHTTGAWQVIGVAPTYKIAQLMEEEERKPSKPGQYKCWEGYFESLEDIEIHTLELV